ncbi:hypothetical protein BSKO_06193 [Bryopsis sp. KO-2023]|nr:hypothetical protein BSKO_06193 [Bryopsis sp. KO-2023]
MHVKTVCREVRANGGDVPVLYVFVAWKGTSFDVQVTDGSDAWEAFDCACPRNTAVGEEAWLINAEKALVLGEGGYDFETERKSDGSLELRWFWQLEHVAPSTRAMGRCGLKPSQNVKETVQGILRLACGSFDAMRGAVERMVLEKSALEARLDELRQVLERRVEDWEAGEGQMFERFATLINSSRARAQELEGKLDSATRGGFEIKQGNRDDENSDPYDAMTEDDSLPDPPSPEMTKTAMDPNTGGSPKVIGTSVRTAGPVIETSVRTAGPVFEAMDAGFVQDDQRQGGGGGGSSTFDFMNMDTQPIRDGGGDGGFGADRAARVRARVRARPVGRKR